MNNRVELMDIQAKRKALKTKVRKRKAIKKAIGNALGFVVLSIGMFLFIEGALTAWDNEIEAHAEYNRQYIRQIEMNKVDR